MIAFLSLRYRLQTRFAAFFISFRIRILNWETEKFSDWNSEVYIKTLSSRIVAKLLMSEYVRGLGLQA